tara:strand:+ start:5006 stop:5560 length:555 start_codon:yes stop_codon:yes gene_type:complete
MKKLIVFCSTCILSFEVFSNQLNYAEVDADVTLRQSVVINNVKDLQFGVLEYDPADTGGFIILEPTSQVFLGNTGYISSGTATAGSLDIIAAQGETVNISCTPTARLSRENHPSETIPLSGAKYIINGLMWFCSSGMHDFVSGGTDSIHIGAKLTVPTGSQAKPGTYSTSNTGGIPLSFTVTYE